MIITTQAAVAGAAMEDLLASYAHYTGRAVRRFASRAVAERRVVDALMSSADAAGHLGVPRGSSAPPLSHAELVQRAAETGRADPAELVAAARLGAIEGDAGVGLPAPGSENGSCAHSAPSAPHPERHNPYPPGSLAARIWAAAEGKPLPEPEPAPSAGPLRRPQRKVASDVLVRAAGPGTATVRATSARGAVLAAVLAAGADGIALSALAERFGADVARGCVGKLCATNHVSTTTT